MELQSYVVNLGNLIPTTSLQYRLLQLFAAGTCDSPGDAVRPSGELEPVDTLQWL